MALVKITSDYWTRQLTDLLEKTSIAFSASLFSWNIQRTVLIKRLGLMVCLFSIMPMYDAQAEVFYSTDFNRRSVIIDTWELNNSYYFPRNAMKRVDGRGLTLREESFGYITAVPPSDTQSITVKFWLRIGHDSFSQTPTADARVEFQWINENGSWESIEIDSGSGNAGQVINVDITLSIDRFDNPSDLVYVSVDTFGTSAEYHIDNFSVEANANVDPDAILIQSSQSSASVCVPSTITLSVVDASNNAIDDFAGFVDISTSTANGDWSMQNPNGRLQSGPADSGAASYEFAAEDQGQVTLLLSNQHAEVLTVNAGDRSSAASGVSTNISYAENAFVLDYSSIEGQDVIAFRPHPIQVSMVRRDPSTGDCGVATNYQSTNTRMRLQYKNGADMLIRPDWLIDGVTSTSTNTYSSRPLIFSDGLASFHVISKDAGQFSVELNDRSQQFSDQAINGSSHVLSSRPFALYVDTAANPAAQNHDGSVFVLAGQEFPVTVAAVGWQIGDDSNNDGVADGHDDSDPLSSADLSDNAHLPGFSDGNSKADVRLSARAIAPAVVTHSNLSGEALISTFNSGQSDTARLSYSNVGIMELEARIASATYLGANSLTTAKIQGRSGFVGRFIPSHFAIEAVDLLPACVAGSFSHMGEGFAVEAQLRAMNRQGIVTDGYQQNYAKLSNALGNIEYNAKHLSSRFNTNQQNIEFSLGIATLNTELTLARGADPEAPLLNVQLGIKLADADGTELETAGLDLDVDPDNGTDNDHNLLGVSDFYYSRLNLPSAHGPETENLKSQLFVESWQGNSFEKNAADSCTQLDRSDISFVQTGELSVDSHRTVTIGSASSTGQYVSLSTNTIDFVSGDAGQEFTAPGLGNRGLIEVDISLEDYPWLRFDWNQDGNHDDNALPRAGFLFGAPRGHDRVVYWRESTP